MLNFVSDLLCGNGRGGGGLKIDALSLAGWGSGLFLVTRQ